MSARETGTSGPGVSRGGGPDWARGRRMTQQSQELMTVADVADLLQSTRAAVYERLRRDPDALPGRVKIGRRVFFRRSVLMSWIASGGG